MIECNYLLLIKFTKCDKEGLNHYEICGLIFCYDHSISFKDMRKRIMQIKRLYCYKAALTDNNGLY